MSNEIDIFKVLINNQAFDFVQNIQLNKSLVSNNEFGGSASLSGILPINFQDFNLLKISNIVNISINDKTVFTGKIISYTTQENFNNQEATFDIQCADNFYDFLQSKIPLTVNKKFTSISAIVSSIFEELSFDDTYKVEIASTISDKLSQNTKELNVAIDITAFEYLSKIVKARGGFMYTDGNKTLYITNQTSNTFPYKLIYQYNNRDNNVLSVQRSNNGEFPIPFYKVYVIGSSIDRNDLGETLKSKSNTVQGIGINSKASKNRINVIKIDQKISQIEANKLAQFFANNYQNFAELIHIEVLGSHIKGNFFQINQLININLIDGSKTLTINNIDIVYSYSTKIYQTRLSCVPSTSLNAITI